MNFDESKLSDLKVASCRYSVVTRVYDEDGFRILRVFLESFFDSIFAGAIILKWEDAGKRSR